MERVPGTVEAEDGFVPRDVQVDADAGSLAVTCIASLEGAVVLFRSTRSVDPLRDVAQQIEFLINSREFVRRYGLPDAGH